MFTGLIEKKGQVIANIDKKGSRRLIIASSYEQLHLGESIAVNGVCLTLLASAIHELEFDVSPETSDLTTLASLKVGDEVNLERAMLASSRFGGHYVSGHIDTTAEIKAIHLINEYHEIEITGFNPQALLYLIPKGSITVDGVSLTINAVINNNIKLMLVPHTLKNTTIGRWSIGQEVNIEFDYFTRIVAHQLQIAGTLNSEVAL